MGRLERALFIVLPVLALALVAWMLITFEFMLSFAWAWVPALGIDFAFRIDGLSALMLLMITGVGIAVFVYAGGYLAGDPGQRRLFILLTLFMIAMGGAVTADNLILLFLFWEATSLLSFLLVGFHHEKLESRKAAQQSLLVTGSGGLVLLAGFILLGQVMGTYRISDIIVALPGTADSPQLTAALLLILVGGFTKSAQFPFHFWLPNAMAAPTPVSAYLHSATMVKLGVYLLARFDPGFGDWVLWEWSLKLIGSITAAWAMLLALRERDLKRILAWSTVATLGTLVTLVGLRGEGASMAVGALLLAHALYKAPLFFVAGNIDYGAGTRNIDHLGNLRRAMPWTAAAALLAGVSMAGIPLSFGYVVKDVILDAQAAGEVFAFAKFANAVFGSVAVAVAGVAAVRVFWRHATGPAPRTVHEVGPAMLVPPLVLASLGIVLGLFPFFAQELIAAATGAMTPESESVAVSLSLAFGPVLVSLLITMLVGVTIYLFWDPLHNQFERLAGRFDRISMVAQYERVLQGIPRLAAAATRAMQNGQLPTYVLLVLVGVSIALLGALSVGWSGLTWPQLGGWPTLGVLGACLLIITGGVVACLVRDRLVMLLAAGLVGYGSGLLFLFTGAPDVAYTQFTVETVFVIVVASVLLALRRVHRTAGLDEARWRPGALLVSAAFAALISVVLLVILGVEFDPTVSQFFAASSVPEAYGRNVVNVILVDFRALDTLGEIAVVLLSLLAALPLMRALRARSSARGRT